MMFVGTYDHELVNKLKQYGYPVVNTFPCGEHTVFLFKDIKKLSFTLEDRDKIFYSNKLTF